MAEGLRERVKAGKITPKEALKWLNKQEFKNPKLMEWLRRRGSSKPSAKENEDE